jgi:hypothetical protein
VCLCVVCVCICIPQSAASSAHSGASTGAAGTNTTLKSAQQTHANTAPARCTKSALPTGGGSAFHPNASHPAAECHKIKLVSSNRETERDRERQRETGQSMLREVSLLDLGCGVQIENCALAQIAVDGETFPVGTELLSYAPPLLWQGTLLCVGSSGDVRGARMRARAAVRAVHLDGDDMEVRRCGLCVGDFLCVCVCQFLYVDFPYLCMRVYMHASGHVYANMCFHVSRACMVSGHVGRRKLGVSSA